MIRPLKVYFSYAHADLEFARKLATDLQVDGNFDVWLDVDRIRMSDQVEITIREAITNSDLLMVLLSFLSVQSKWAMQEAELAASKGIGRVIPVIIDEKAKSALPDFLKTIQWLDLSTPKLYSLGVRELLDFSLKGEKEQPFRGEKISPGSITAGGNINIAAPHISRMSDIIDVDDFVAKVAEKLRHKFPLGGEDPDGHQASKRFTDLPSRLVFVVMSFEDDMEPVFEGIKAAAAEAGLEAKRVKDEVGDYKIDSKLIDMIARACMVVVDLTHERPNVYFELGYARGIGKTVITTARKGTPLHFDVQSWTCDFYSDSRVLEKRLKERFKLEWARLVPRVATSPSA